MFDREDAGIEILTQLYDITRQEKAKRIRAKIEYSAALSNSDDLTSMASGELEIHLGLASRSLLYTRSSALPHMVDVETDRFYRALE